MLRGDPIEEVRALKAMPGHLDITATGSMQLVTGGWSPAAWSTSTGCSCTPSWPARVSACSPMPPTLALSAWSRPSPGPSGPAPLPPVRANDHALNDTASATRP